jgi:hypothetical protein
VRFSLPASKPIQGWAAAASDGAHGAWLVPMYATADSGFGRAHGRQVQHVDARGRPALHELTRDRLEIRYVAAGADGRPILGGLFAGSPVLASTAGAAPRLAAPGGGRADFLLALDGAARPLWGAGLAELPAGRLAGLAATPGGGLVAAFLVRHDFLRHGDLVLTARDTAGAARWSRTFDGAISEGELLVGPFVDGRGSIYVGAARLVLDGRGTALDGSADAGIDVARLDDGGSVAWMRRAPADGEAAMAADTEGHVALAHVHQMDLVISLLGPGGEHLWSRAVPLPAACRDPRDGHGEPTGYAARVAVDTSFVFAAALCARMVDDFWGIREPPRAVVAAVARR